MSAKETVVPYGDDAAPYDNDDLSAFADQVRHDYGWCFDSDRAQAARWLATVDALRAERDEVAKAERERIARKFDDKATTCRAMLKVETNIGRLAEYARAVAEWEFCAAMAREEAK